MIDTSKYEGHEEGWDKLSFTCGQGFLKTFGYQTCNDSDNALLRDAPLILEELIKAQARIEELEERVRDLQYKLNKADIDF